MRRNLMRFPRNLPAVVLTILLAVCLVAYYSTRDSAKPAAPQKNSAAAEQLVDTSLLQTELELAPLAATPDEQGQAHEAWRLADHELDLTFAGGLREGEAAAALPANGPMRQLRDRITKLLEHLETDKKRVEVLSKDTSDALDLA